MYQRFKKFSADRWCDFDDDVDVENDDLDDGPEDDADAFCRSSSDDDDAPGTASAGAKNVPEPAEEPEKPGPIESWSVKELVAELRYNTLIAGMGNALKRSRWDFLVDGFLFALCSNERSNEFLSRLCTCMLNCLCIIH